MSIVAKIILSILTFILILGLSLFTTGVQNRIVIFEDGMIVGAPSLSGFEEVQKGVLPPLESMACGVPVITSNVSSLPEVVADAGLQVSPVDDVGLAVAMQSLLDDDALHARLAQAALVRSAGFTWAECARQTREVYGLAMADAGV